MLAVMIVSMNCSVEVIVAYSCDFGTFYRALFGPSRACTVPSTLSCAISDSTKVIAGLCCAAYRRSSPIQPAVFSFLPTSSYLKSVWSVILYRYFSFRVPSFFFHTSSSVLFAFLNLWNAGYATP